MRVKEIEHETIYKVGASREVESRDRDASDDASAAVEVRTPGAL